MSESETYMVLFNAMDGNLRMSERHRLLKLYAHELAEKIRNSEELRGFTDDHMSDCNAAADLIDPEVS